MINDRGMLILETYMDLEARGLVELETKSIKKNIQVRRNEREDDLSPPWEVQGKVHGVNEEQSDHPHR